MSKKVKKSEEDQEKDKDQENLQQKLIVDDYQQKFDEEQFKDEFPSIYKELTFDRKPMGLKFTDDSEEGENGDLDEILGEGALVKEDPALTLKEIQRRRIENDPLSDFDPGIIDFIRRAKVPEDAIEVVEYLKAKGEITENLAIEIITQIQNHGLESFGKQKPDGYYFHYASEEKMKKAMKKLRKKSRESNNNKQ